MEYGVKRMENGGDILVNGHDVQRVKYVETSVGTDLA